MIADLPQIPMVVRLHRGPGTLTWKTTRLSAGGLKKKLRAGLAFLTVTEP
jgi:hypothetical protein